MKKVNAKMRPEVAIADYPASVLQSRYLFLKKAIIAMSHRAEFVPADVR